MFDKVTQKVIPSYRQILRFTKMCKIPIIVQDLMEKISISI